MYNIDLLIKNYDDCTNAILIKFVSCRVIHLQKTLETFSTNVSTTNDTRNKHEILFYMRNISRKHTFIKVYDITTIMSTDTFAFFFNKSPLN